MGTLGLASRSVERAELCGPRHHSPAGKLSRAGSPRRSQVFPRTPLSTHASCMKVQSCSILDPPCSAASPRRTGAMRALGEDGTYRKLIELAVESQVGAGVVGLVKLVFGGSEAKASNGQSRDPRVLAMHAGNGRCDYQARSLAGGVVVKAHR